MNPTPPPTTKTAKIIMTVFIQLLRGCSETTWPSWLTVSGSSFISFIAEGRTDSAFGAAPNFNDFKSASIVRIETSGLETGLIGGWLADLGADSSTNGKLPGGVTSETGRTGGGAIFCDSLFEFICSSIYRSIANRYLILFFVQFYLINPLATIPRDSGQRSHKNKTKPTRNLS